MQDDLDKITTRISQTVSCTEAEGPGNRYALWFQGCPLRCPSCCNPEYLSFQGGVLRSVSEILQEILEINSANKLTEKLTIEGITLLGGEPFAHSQFAAHLAREVQQHQLSVMVFTGYTRQQLEEQKDFWVDLLLTHTDILVDGPYLRDYPDTQRRWIGSTNQQIHFLTDRYAPDDPCWQKRNTLEIRLSAEGQLVVNGFPDPNLSSLWRGKFEGKIKK